MLIRNKHNKIDMQFMYNYSSAVILSQIFLCDYSHKNTNNSFTSGWIPRKTNTNMYTCIPTTCQNLANQTIPGGRWSCQPRLGQVNKLEQMWYTLVNLSGH